MAKKSRLPEKRVQVTVQLDENVKADILQKAIENERSLSGEISKAIKFYLEFSEEKTYFKGRHQEQHQEQQKQNIIIQQHRQTKEEKEEHIIPKITLDINTKEEPMLEKPKNNIGLGAFGSKKVKNPN